MNEATPETLKQRNATKTLRHKGAQSAVFQFGNLSET